MARLNWEKMEVDRRTHRYGAARIGSLAGARRDAEADAKPLRPWTDAQLLKLDALQEKRRLQEQEQKEPAEAPAKERNGTCEARAEPGEATGPKKTGTRETPSAPAGKGGTTRSCCSGATPAEPR